LSIEKNKYGGNTVITRYGFHMVNYTKIAFDNAPIGLVMAENRIIQCCNLKFSTMLGYRQRDIQGQSFRMFYGSNEEFERIRDVGINTLKTKGEYSDERLLRHQNGHSVWCRFRAHSLTQNNPLDRIILSYAQISNNAQSINLSKRERQVLGLMSQEMSSKQIAQELNLSPRTIDDVRARLIKRYKVKRCSDLLSRMTGLG
jgi:PAS domain S-box-containing protein